MKKITELDTKPIPLQLRDDQTLDKEVTDKLLTYRELFYLAVSASLSKSGSEALDLFEIGLKLKKCKEDSIDLEDAEFTKLKDKCDTNPLQTWSAYLHAQIMKKLKDAENAKVEPEVKK